MSYKPRKVVPIGFPRFSYTPQLCIVGTTTPEKIAHLNVGAKAKNLPIRFISLKEILDAFLSAKEDTGKSTKNAEKKLQAIEASIEGFKTDPVFRRVLKDKWKSIFGKNFPFAESGVSFITEDSTFVLPKDIWDHLVPKIRHLVPKDILENALRNEQGSGPGAETGPIMAAVGMWEFFELIRESALACGYQGKTVPIIDRSVCTIKRLNESSTEAPAPMVRAEVELCLARDDLSVPFPPVPEGTIEASRYFMAEPETPGQPINKYWNEFLGLRSVRSQMAEKLYVKLSGKNFRLPTALVQRIWAPPITKAPADFHALAVNQAVLDKHKKTIGRRAKSSDLLTAALDMTDIVHKPDALVFAPLSSLKTEADKRLALYVFFSAVVSKSLDSENVNLPVIVQNDGSWTPTLNLLAELVNKGMAKGYEECRIFGTFPPSWKSSAKHRCFCHIDVLESESKGVLHRAADELLAFRKIGYHRYCSPGDLCRDFQLFGEFPTERRYTEVGLVSASTDNRKALQHASAHGMVSAEESYNHGTGGGTRHGMGALRDGYLSANGLFDISFSTPVIVKTETDNGRLPESALGALCHNIYQREAYLIGLADQVAALPGGAGTVKEIAAFFVLRDLFPKIMATKSILFHSPDIRKDRNEPGQEPFWATTMELFMPKANVQKLFRDPMALADQGLYLSTDIPDMKRAMRAGHAAWVKNTSKDRDRGWNIVRGSIGKQREMALACREGARRHIALRQG